jgi:hypothetical protein
MDGLGNGGVDLPFGGWALVFAPKLRGHLRRPIALAFQVVDQDDEAVALLRLDCVLGAGTASSTCERTERRSKPLRARMPTSMPRSSLPSISTTRSYGFPSTFFNSSSENSFSAVRLSASTTPKSPVYTRRSIVDAGRHGGRRCRPPVWLKWPVWHGSLDLLLLLQPERDQQIRTIRIF